MADTTVNLKLATRSPGSRPYIVTDAVQVYIGSLCGLSLTTGKLVKWADTAAFMFLGVATQKILGASATNPTCSVDCSGVILERVTVTGASAVTDVGDKVYGTDDQTFTLTPGSNTKAIGRVTRWHTSTTCDVKLLTPEEYQNQNLSGADITTLTDSTGDSGTHDDTLAAVTEANQLTDNSGGTASTTLADITEANNAGSADRVPTEDAIASLAAELNAANTAIGVLKQNSSDTAQKVIEILAALNLDQ